MPKQFSWSPPSLTEDEEKLIAAYGKIGKPVDHLPYAPEFDKLLHELNIENPTDERRAEVFHHLLRLRKTARLPRFLGMALDASSDTVTLSADDEELISAYSRVGRGLDWLPYTEDFDKLVSELGKPETCAVKHAVFQRLLRLRKRGRLPSK